MEKNPINHVSMIFETLRFFYVIMFYTILNRRFFTEFEVRVVTAEFA